MMVKREKTDVFTLILENDEIDLFHNIVLTAETTFDKTQSKNPKSTKLINEIIKEIEDIEVKE